MSNEVNRSPGFLSFLALLFIGLKLAGYISWSWVWVLAPLWIPLAVAIAILVLGVIIHVINGVN